jgi:hypothetical protein
LYKLTINFFFQKTFVEIKKRLVHPSSGKKKGLAKIISSLKGPNAHQRFYQSKTIED